MGSRFNFHIIPDSLPKILGYSPVASARPMSRLHSATGHYGPDARFSENEPIMYGRGLWGQNCPYTNIYELRTRARLKSS